jgi:hypothetical protein
MQMNIEHSKANIEHRTFNIEHRSSDGLSKAIGINSATSLETGAFAETDHQGLPSSRNQLRAFLEGEACRAATSALPTSSIHHPPLTIASSSIHPYPSPINHEI